MTKVGTDNGPYLPFVTVLTPQCSFTIAAIRAMCSDGRDSIRLGTVRDLVRSLSATYCNYFLGLYEIRNRYSGRAASHLLLREV